MQETGRPVLLVDRVVEDREVQEREPLRLQEGVLEERVVVDVEHHRARRDLPARLRLHAGREGALRDPVLLRADLLDPLPVEVDVRLLPAQHRPLRLFADHRGARGVEERAKARLGVELGAVGGDPILALREDHVARGDHLVGVGEGLDFVGVEGHVAPAGLDLADELHSGPSQAVPCATSAPCRTPCPAGRRPRPAWRRARPHPGRGARRAGRRSSGRPAATRT